MTTTNHPVAVDPGDLSEALQAAEAWAGLLRCRLRYARTEFGRCADCSRRHGPV